MSKKSKYSNLKLEFTITLDKKGTVHWIAYKGSNAEVPLQDVEKFVKEAKEGLDNRLEHWRKLY